jgi:hypothetical protein
MSSFDYLRILNNAILHVRYEAAIAIDIDIAIAAGAARPALHPFAT